MQNKKSPAETDSEDMEWFRKYIENQIEKQQQEYL